ncbi:MAG TPA: hypothetical protein VGR97_11865 [Candidatus Acidoferrales bacterium]|nr:hypothetical protein [Candidatus Acidoferrales bacterium]
MAVEGCYMAWRIRQGVLPFVRVYGQWVEERIIPLDSQLTAMADAVEKQAYDELMSQPVGEDYSGDGSEEAESAFNIGLSFYENIADTYQGTLNLFGAGLFHVAEQQLANLTRDGAIDIEGSDTKLSNLIDWYNQHFQIDLKQFPSWPLIDELRLVANTVKHAEGSSETQLRRIRPEIFQRPLIREDPNISAFPMPVHVPLGGDGLYVTGDDFRNYHKAVLCLFEWLVEFFENHSDRYYPR